jgi:hypothetical protein
MVEEIKGPYSALTLEQMRLVHGFLNEVVAVLQTQVHEICGWFIRPVFRRDLYELNVLVNSTLSLVRELDDTYDFVESVAVDPSIEIDRATFEFVGDTLFVLIGNAAKHGRRGGLVSVVGRHIGESKEKIAIRVKSETAEAAEYEKAISTIRSALAVQTTQALDLAAVGEGFSGLRKIAGLVRRMRSSEVTLRFQPEPGSLSVSFELMTPAQVGGVREGG